jgi:hypothetical protein
METMPLLANNLQSNAAFAALFVAKLKARIYEPMP